MGFMLTVGAFSRMSLFSPLQGSYLDSLPSVLLARSSTAVLQVFTVKRSICYSTAFCLAGELSSCLLAGSALNTSSPNYWFPLVLAIRLMAQVRAALCGAEVSGTSWCWATLQVPVLMSFPGDCMQHPGKVLSFRSKDIPRIASLPTNAWENYWNV